ncbi:hypothetical protein BH20ACI3_BH20ACI3_00470 [soil metagenome]
MCRIDISFYQQIVEPMLGSSRQAVWHVKSELTETGRSDRYQQGSDSLTAIAQVLQACIDKITTRQSCVHCAYFNATEPNAASGAINFCARLISGWG